MSLIYLASPYTHMNNRVRIQRFDSVCWYANECFRQGKVVLSPIAHSHPLVRFGACGDADTWREWNRKLMKRCDSLEILALDGWIESLGVQRERDHAHELRKRVVIVVKQMPCRIAGGEFHYLNSAGVWSLDMVKLNAAVDIGTANS